ncbi:MAG: hypothetical protein HOH86_00715 [Verrucomicrobiales bacterium]|nr:hypothetical protein [Verrucomicrobiales bacterium]
MDFLCYWHCICYVNTTVKPVYSIIKSAALALSCLCIFSSCKYLPLHKPAEAPPEPTPDILSVPPAPVEAPPVNVTPAVATTPLVPSVTANLKNPAAHAVTPGQLAPVMPHRPIPPVAPTVIEAPLNPSATTGAVLLAGSVERSQTDLLFYQVGNPKPFTGSTTLLHENGARKFDGAFKDGRREGEGMEWYLNGKLRYEGMFKGDRLYEGLAFWYYVDSGAVKMRANYVKGQLVRGLHWNRNGDLFR